MKKKEVLWQCHAKCCKSKTTKDSRTQSSDFLCAYRFFLITVPFMQLWEFAIWFTYHSATYLWRLTVTLIWWSLATRSSFLHCIITVYFLFYLRRGNRGQSSLRELLQPLVEGVLNDKNLSINTNPLEVYKAWINQMESETGEARYQMLILSAHLLF